MHAKRRRRQYVWCWIFALPTTLFYLGFQAWPILSSVYYSTLDWSGIGSDRTFVALDNFKELLGDPWFWNAFLNSFKYMLYSVPLLIVLSLFLAVLLNEKTLRFRGGFRTMFFLPVITTASIVGIIMMFIWSPIPAHWRTAGGIPVSPIRPPTMSISAPIPTGIMCLRTWPTLAPTRCS